MNFKYAVVILLLVAATGCHKKLPEVEPRAFYMAVTPWPADFTSAAVEESYQFIDQHCDMVSHHFDEGIPYEEAIQASAWPQALQNEVAFRKARTGTKPVFLSVAPLNLTRRQKADYYRNSIGIADSTKQRWGGLAIDAEPVVTAYVRYVSYLIDELKPRFVNYGVESNEINWDSAAFRLYKNFLAKVYRQLKNAYPQLPFFVSFMVNEHPAALTLAAQLLPYSDAVSLSAYPYTSAASTADGNTDPKKFAADYFTRFLDLAPGKPWGFAETGYIAQDLIVPSFSLNKRGTPAWQRDYLDLVCQLANTRRAQFLVWFCHADYDKGNDRLKAAGLYNDLFALWQDTGLEDEAGAGRPAYGLWLQWMQKEKQ